MADENEFFEFHSLIATEIGWECSAPSCDWYAIDLADEKIAAEVWSNDHTHGEP